MLRFTSCLFATIVIHAFHLPRSDRTECYHLLFLLVTVFSLLYHTHSFGGHLATAVGFLDRVFAYAAFLYVMLEDTKRALDQSCLWLLLFPFFVVFLWMSEFVWPDRSDSLHAALHVLSVVGVHLYLAVLL